jgi:hypothetical protein
MHNYFNTCKQVAFVYFGHECNSMHNSTFGSSLHRGRHRRAKSMDLRALLYCPCRPCFERSCSCPGSCFVGSCPAHGATLWPCLSNGATAIQSATLWSCTRRYGHSKVCFENKKNDSCSHADLIPDSCYKFNLFYSISKTKSNKILKMSDEGSRL